MLNRYCAIHNCLPFSGAKIREFENMAKCQKKSFSLMKWLIINEVHESPWLDIRCKHTMKPKLIIIGAGACGIMAADLLAEKYSITILEAADYVGGRIRTIPPEGIESGAEFIHGNLEQTFRILNEAGISAEKCTGKFYRKTSALKESEIPDGLGELLSKMKMEENDCTLLEFLDKHFEYDVEKRKQAIAYANGFNVAPEEKVSMKALYKEWKDESEDLYRPVGGYSSMIRHIATRTEKNGATIHLSSMVTTIHWNENSVEVFTETGRSYHGDKLLITVPVSVLQNTAVAGGISFSPDLPVYREAARNIGFGSVIKVVLEFKERFWPEDADFIFAEEKFPTWWTHTPDKSFFLTGWVGGPQAAKLSVRTDEYLATMALQSLTSIFDISLEVVDQILVKSHVFNWQKQPYISGAYHYIMPQSEKAKETLRTPVHNTIFFAGEALHSGNAPGTVEAALQSAVDVSKLRDIYK